MNAIIRVEWLVTDRGRWSGCISGLAAGLAVLAACGGGRGVSNTELSPTACDTEPMQGRLLTVSDVIDSLLLARDVSSVAFAARDRAVAITVVYGYGGNAFAEATASELSDQQTAALVSRIRPRLRSRGMGEPTAVRLQIRAGANPSITAERPGYCPPQLRLASLRAPRQNVTVSDRGRVRRVFRAVTGFRIRVAISETGAVMAVTDVQTRGALWGIVYEEIIEWRYDPATVDGIPTQSFVEYEAWQLGRFADRIR